MAMSIKLSHTGRELLGSEFKSQLMGLLFENGGPLTLHFTGSVRFVRVGTRDSFLEEITFNNIEEFNHFLTQRFHLALGTELGERRLRIDYEIGPLVGHFNHDLQVTDSTIYEERTNALTALSDGFALLKTLLTELGLNPSVVFTAEHPGDIARQITNGLGEVFVTDAARREAETTFQRLIEIAREMHPPGADVNTGLDALAARVTIALEELANLRINTARQYSVNLNDLEHAIPINVDRFTEVLGTEADAYLNAFFGNEPALRLFLHRAGEVQAVRHVQDAWDQYQNDLQLQEETAAIAELREPTDNFLQDLNGVQPGGIAAAFTVMQGLQGLINLLPHDNPYTQFTQDNPSFVEFFDLLNMLVEYRRTVPEHEPDYRYTIDQINLITQMNEQGDRLQQLADVINAAEFDFQYFDFMNGLRDAVHNMIPFDRLAALDQYRVDLLTQARTEDPDMQVARLTALDGIENNMFDRFMAAEDPRTGTFISRLHQLFKNAWNTFSDDIERFRHDMVGENKLHTDVARLLSVVAMIKTAIAVGEAWFDGPDFFHDLMEAYGVAAAQNHVARMVVREAEAVDLESDFELIDRTATEIFRQDGMDAYLENAGDITDITLRVPPDQRIAWANQFFVNQPGPDNTTTDDGGRVYTFTRAEGEGGAAFVARVEAAIDAMEIDFNDAPLGFEANLAILRQGVPEPISAVVYLGPNNGIVEQGYGHEILRLLANRLKEKAKKIADDHEHDIPPHNNDEDDPDSGSGSSDQYVFKKYSDPKRQGGYWQKVEAPVGGEGGATDDISITQVSISVISVGATYKDQTGVTTENGIEQKTFAFVKDDSTLLFDFLFNAMTLVKEKTLGNQLNVVGHESGSVVITQKTKISFVYKDENGELQTYTGEWGTHDVTVHPSVVSAQAPIIPEADVLEAVVTNDAPVKNLSEVFHAKQPPVNSGDKVKAVLIGFADLDGGEFVIKDDVHDYQLNKSLFGQDTPRYARSLVFIKHANESDQAFIARINEHIAKVVYEADPGAGQLVTFNLAVNAVWKIEGSDGGKKYLTENENYHFKSFRKDKGVLEDDPDYEVASSDYNSMTFDGRDHNFVLHKNTHMQEVMKTHYEYNVVNAAIGATLTTATVAPELLPPLLGVEAAGALFLLGKVAVNSLWSSGSAHHDELRKRSLNPDDNIAFQYEENSLVSPFENLLNATVDSGDMPNIMLTGVSFKNADYNELLEMVANTENGDATSASHWSNFVQFQVVRHGDNNEFYSLFLASKFLGGVDYQHHINALKDLAYSNKDDQFDSLTKEMAIVLIDENMDVVANVFDVAITPVNDAPVLDFDLNSASEHTASVLVAGDEETYLLQNAISLTDKDEAGYRGITMYSRGLVDYNERSAAPNELLKYHSRATDHQYDIPIAEAATGRFALDVPAGEAPIYIRYQTVSQGNGFTTKYWGELTNGASTNLTTQHILELLMNLKYVNTAYNYDWDMDLTPQPMRNPTLGLRTFTFTVTDNSGYEQSIAENETSNAATATINVVEDDSVNVVDDTYTLHVNNLSAIPTFNLLSNDYGSALTVDYVVLDSLPDYHFTIAGQASRMVWLDESNGLQMHITADGDVKLRYFDNTQGFVALSAGQTQEIGLHYVLTGGQVGHVTYTIVGANDAPELMSHANMTFSTHSGGSTHIGNQFAGWLDDTAAGINDVDANSKIKKMKIDISDGAGHVRFAETADLTGLVLHYSLDGKTLEITGEKSTADYNQLLQGLIYEAAVIENGQRQNVMIAGDQTVSVQVQDEHGYWSNRADVLVQVDPINVEANDDVIQAHEDMLSIIKDVVANDVSDHANDNLKITEIMGVAVSEFPDGVLLANGVLVKVINGTKLQFIFNHAFHYLSENTMADFTLAYTVQSDAGQTATANTTVFVSGRNDAALAVDSFIHVDQTGQHVFRASDFGVIDVDVNDVHAVKIISVPNNHLLMVNEYGQEPRTARVGEVFTAEQINAGILSVQYGGVLTHGSFQFSLLDGHSESAAATMAIDFPDDIDTNEVDIDDPYHLFFSVEMSEDETHTEVGVFDISNFTNWEVISVEAPAYANLTFVKANDGLLHFTYVLNNDAAIVQAISIGESMQHVIRFSLQMDNEIVEGQLNAVITGVNDKPVITMDSADLTVRENNQVYFENKNVMVTDADDQFIDHVTFELIGSGKLGVNAAALKADLPWMDVEIVDDKTLKLKGPAGGADYQLATQYVFFDATDVAGGNQTIKVTAQDKLGDHALTSDAVFFDISVTSAAPVPVMTEYTAETVVFSVEEDVHDKRLASSSIFEFDITDVSEWTINYGSSDYGAFVVSAADGVVTLNFALNNDDERVQALNDDDQPLEEVLDYYITKNDGTEKISGRAIVEIKGHDEDFVLVNETITGNNWSEMLTGTDADNVMNAMGGNDYVYGLAGDDELNGGDDGDVLNGGAGNDVLTGGAGADVFYLSGLDELQNDAEQTTITDMVFGEDTVILGNMATYILENELGYESGDIDAAIINLVSGNEVTGGNGSTFKVDVSEDADGDSQLRYLVNNEVAHTVKFVGHTFTQDGFEAMVNADSASVLFS